MYIHIYVDLYQKPMSIFTPACFRKAAYRHSSIHRLAHKYADSQIQNGHCAHARTQPDAQRPVCIFPFSTCPVPKKCAQRESNPGEKACVNATAHSVP